MSVASLFDAVQEHDRSRFVEMLVKSSREDYARLREYEEEFGPSLADEKKDSAALELFRSIWKLYEQWANEAEQVLARVRVVAGAERLRDDYGAARARLTINPESIIVAKQQLRRGEGIPVEVLRDELRRRRGA
jgi:hypothetical protein